MNTKLFKRTMKQLNAVKEKKKKRKILIHVFLANNHRYAQFCILFYKHNSKSRQ